jgi:hypothetical protein
LIIILTIITWRQYNKNKKKEKREAREQRASQAAFAGNGVAIGGNQSQNRSLAQQRQSNADRDANE